MELSQFGGWLPIIICAALVLGYYALRWGENALDRVLHSWDRSRPDHPVFKALRSEQFRLGQEGFVLDTEGFVECATCGPHNCGQCGNGNRVGLHIMEYKERFWK